MKSIGNNNKFKEEIHLTETQIVEAMKFYKETFHLNVQGDFSF